MFTDVSDHLIKYCLLCGDAIILHNLFQYIYFYLVNRVFVPCGASAIHSSPLPHCPPSFSLRFGNLLYPKHKREKEIGGRVAGGMKWIFLFCQEMSGSKNIQLGVSMMA